ncbi:MAG: 1-(5-phosphoribosyl)-5-amino-4-imidazole-carboxylate carboxylase, partial [Selenomonadaceae bacterium]|nr:1-(5-phosphoribosyl)-5-amino-4-imidazole-carboxylate carboxylase [Selenomonadaceae bacterium]
MNEKNLRELLSRFRAGEVSEDQAVATLKNISLTAVEDLGFASIDHQRELRQGFPEVVYAAGKTKEQLRAILRSLYERSGGNLIATRASVEQCEFVRAELPMMTYDPTARMIYL